jgi:hypothetical protein
MVKLAGTVRAAALATVVASAVAFAGAGPAYADHSPAGRRRRARLVNQQWRMGLGPVSKWVTATH